MKKLITILFAAVLLSGCIEGEQHRYSGNSGSWSMTYKVVESQSGSQQVEGLLNYIGPETAPERIEYSMSTVTQSQSATGIPVTDGKATLQNTNCVDCGIIQEHTKIKVEIKWDGTSETFHLDEEES
ncbi:hypothetical protein AUC31_14680 [Planococcus rifietoensis]|uniref:Lipoprotein n=1 Tax=Planococcus rifietoensis TaxID=200991 RepID=A0A0U2ZAW6_9BACL|nr:membrane lipoprotein lipid attachment site-containing protein [Planococcus rifietoensis]ALS76364.1 hypothetical protein AUC31_14680 [Planococcus rifietoensis]